MEGIDMLDFERRKAVFKRLQKKLGEAEDAMWAPLQEKYAAAQAANDVVTLEEIIRILPSGFYRTEVRTQGEIIKAL